jgi:heme iron utilization protein
VSSTPSGKHASGSATTVRPIVPEPSFAERARTLLHLGRIGSLSTLSRKQSGFPFGSVMPYAPDECGRPIFLISSMAMHTHNLMEDPRASLLITQADASADPLGASRVTLLGNVQAVHGAEAAELRPLYLARYENSRYWVDYEDFSFYRMDVVDVYYVGGFGVMGWVSAEQYAGARPDPLADAAAGILEHMNTDHKEALVLLARAFARLDAHEVAITSIDRLGCQLRLRTEDGMRGARISFVREVGTPSEARDVFIEMLQQARHT